MLNKEQFSSIVELTPLVSIDLIIEDSNQKILLGLRKNRPAQGYWFVPGGRILKDETLGQAFERIARNEIGSALDIDDAEPIGAFNHMYADNFSGEGFSTHYVALGYRVKIKGELSTLPQQQHSDYRWLTVSELLEDALVHDNTKAYFDRAYALK